MFSRHQQRQIKENTNLLSGIHCSYPHTDYGRLYKQALRKTLPPWVLNELRIIVVFMTLFKILLILKTCSVFQI